MNMTMKTTAGDMTLPERLELECAIERGKHAFFEVGKALSEIRDRRGYKPEFKSFTEYCQKRWGWSRQSAAYYIDAAKVVGLLPPEMSSQLDITHAAELARLVKPPAENGDGRKKEIDAVAIKQLAETVNLSGSTTRQLRRAVGKKNREDKRAKLIARNSAELKSWKTWKPDPIDSLLHLIEPGMVLHYLENVSSAAKANKEKTVSRDVAEIPGAVELLKTMNDEIGAAIRDCRQRIESALKQAHLSAEHSALTKT